MSDYDFRQLNDKEFEILCADVLGIVTGYRIERFKPGKDAGVDGRFFANPDKEVIIQCKHWANTPITTLIRTLRNDELPKLNKLKPSRYYLAISNPLSRADKKAICTALHPHISSASDILGKEDLNDIIKLNPEIEKRNYKLWLHSTSILEHVFNSAVIGRSEFSLNEILRSAPRYAVTKSHAAALQILDRLGVVIISGEPGIGKTTLAEHLCLHYIAEGFSYYKIDSDIHEAESIFHKDTKQIFYFDDFLGRNYLDALRGHEGSQITQFIKRIAHHKNKKFVLTSRSTILNQGKILIDSFEHSNLQKNEHELRISNLTDIDKARILYNHIWHSGLDSSFIEQLYIQKRYRVVISHKNFNPRLISYITDPARLESQNPEEYWGYITHSLTHPGQIWENPFTAQLDDFGRSIVLLVAINGHAISEATLSRAYQRYLKLPDNKHLKGRSEFLTNMRSLTGSFLSRIIPSFGGPRIDLFNPSIGDFILQRYSGDIPTIRNALQCLQTSHSISTLLSLEKSKEISKNDGYNACKTIIRALSATNFDEVEIPYISSLCKSAIGWLPGNEDALDYIQKAILYILHKGGKNITSDSLEVMRWALTKNIILPTDAVDFIRDNIFSIVSDDEISNAYSLLNATPESTPLHIEQLDALREHVIEMFRDNISEFIDADQAYAQAGYGNYSAASQALEQLIQDKLDDLGANYSAGDLRSIIDALNIQYELDRFYENSYEPEEEFIRTPIERSSDEIDDLFDRS